MKRKVKKGSSLLYVVIISAVLITLGTAIISLTVVDYKMRIGEETKIKNLYGSESGIEEAYGKVSNLMDKAIEEGKKKVKEYENTLSTTIEKEREKVLEDSKNKSDYIKDNGEINEEYIENEKEKIFKDNYKKIIEGNFKTVVEEDYIEKNGYKPIVKIKSLEESLKFNKENKFQAVVQSEFKEKSDIKKIIETTINISVPDYEGISSVKIVKVPVNETWSKAIVADKNFMVNSNTDIRGDIFIRGEEKQDFTGGIKIATNSKLCTIGDVVTAGDIKLGGQNGGFIVKGKDHSTLGQVFTGTLAIEKNSEGSAIDINGDVYSNNDLALNSNQSNISISHGFYGINDIRDGSKEVKKNSSSIYINNEDLGKDSSIVIGQEVVLMGTAYINTNEPYQTGESLAIKGNYRAYGYGLKSGKNKEDISLKEDNVVFKYNDPLQLATSFKNPNRDMLYGDRSDYINQYIKENPSSPIINNGGSGLKLPSNIINIGGIFNNGSFQPSNYSEDDLDKVNKLKNSYKNAIESVDIGKDIKFQSEKVFKLNGSEILLVDESDKKVNILGKGTVPDADAYAINVDDKDKAKGIIVTRGDVVLKGNIKEFKGTIITTGNIICDNNGAKKINYDGNYVKEVIASNYDLFKDVIPEGADSHTVKLSINNAFVNGVPTKELLTMKNWKIIK